MSQQPNLFGLIGAQNAMIFLNGFHFISGEPTHSLQANHHCTVNSPDFIQCLIYVPGSNPARIAGIEYIVSGATFAKLPMEERQLWHSHQYEVSSGLLIEPGMPGSVDLEVMKILVDSYGKTFHTWRYDQKNNSLPLGIPEIVNGYTGDGQLPTDLVATRNNYFAVNSTEIKAQRAGITVPPIQEGADIWKQGIVLKLELTRQNMKNVPFTGPKKRQDILAG
jgi:hypothetical protein